MKTHLKMADGTSHCSVSHAGRLDDDVRHVDCLACMKTPAYAAAKEADDAARVAAFDAQEPREVKEPWKDGNMECSNCMGRKFREGDRTCYGHYANYVCADCGETTSRLTETGMSF